MRFIYYVSALDDGSWEVVSSLESPAQRFPTRELALVAARQGCRRHWEESGLKCGVRVLDDAGNWVDEALFGQED